MNLLSRLQAERSKFIRNNHGSGLGFHCGDYIASLPSPEKDLSPREKRYLTKNVKQILTNAGATDEQHAITVSDIADKLGPVSIGTQVSLRPRFFPGEGLSYFRPFDLAYHGAMDLVIEGKATMIQQEGFSYYLTASPVKS